MTWEEALEILAAGFLRDVMRDRCRDPDPAVSGPFREIAIRMATGELERVADLISEDPPDAKPVRGRCCG